MKKKIVQNDTYSPVIQLPSHIVLVNDTGVKKTRYQPRKEKRDIKKKKRPSTEIANWYIKPKEEEISNLY